MNYIPTHSPEEARRILDIMKREDERAEKKAKKEAEEKLRQQYANDKKYTRAEMIADIKRQISSSNEKAKHAFDIIWGKQTADERRNMFTVEENKVGFSKYDMNFYGKLFKKVLNNEKLSDYEWKKFQDAVQKVSEKLNAQLSSISKSEKLISSLRRFSLSLTAYITSVFRLH